MCMLQHFSWGPHIGGPRVSKITGPIQGHTHSRFPFIDRKCMSHTHTHTHTTILLLFWNMSRTTWVSRYQKGKTRKVKPIWICWSKEIVSGSGICWAICKSPPHPRQPCQHPTTQFFTGRMPFLPPNQQRQSTEGMKCMSYVLRLLTLFPI